MEHSHPGLAGHMPHRRNGGITTRECEVSTIQNPDDQEPMDGFAAPVSEPDLYATPGPVDADEADFINPR
jgi:hypothetical protein